ncbi:hypothetical protein PPSIR1_29283 [Plesiocystis pacifica SIR-1]|uniref:Uncharacterized protein n=2 Tax=Plesiocystis pacifica TaxID=191768 RepID=A6G624_9BACT|nr:hypothetical protein PPSIR1_29283 [Plesiocystis pacifica SIR-1]
MERSLHLRVWPLALVLYLAPGCGDDGAPSEGGEEIGATESEESTSTEESTESEESTSTEESTESEESTSAEESTESEESTSAEESTDTEEESCEDNAFIGEGVNQDDWGVGIFCDSLWVCVDDQLAATLGEDSQWICAPGGSGYDSCPEQACEFIGRQPLLSEADLESICAVLALPGVDAVYCMTLGG